MTETPSDITPEYIFRRFGTELAPDETPLRVFARFWMFFARRVAWLSLALIPLLIFIWGLARGSIRGVSPTVIIIGVVYLLLVAGILYYLYRDWRNDALIMTDQRLIYVEQTVLFSQRQQEVLLSNVQNIRYDVRGVVAHMFDYGHVRIETAARRSDIDFGPIQHPKDTQDQIMGQVRALRAQTSRRLMAETLRHRLGRQAEPPEIPGLTVLEKQRPRWYEGHVSSFILPNPRIEGDTITWYKHWYFLLSRLFMPFLALVALAALAFFMPAWNVPTVLWIIWGVSVLTALGFLLVRYQLWKGDIYVVTADSLHDIYRTPWGLFGESRRTASLERIQNISFTKPGMLANLMNFGDIRIETAGAEDFSFHGLPQPPAVQQEIYRRQELFRLRREQRQREDLADWLATYRDIDQEIEEEEEE